MAREVAGRQQHLARLAQGPAAAAQRASRGRTRVARDAAAVGTGTMRILSLRRLREFWAEHPDAEASLRSWYRVATQARWQRFTDVRAHYRSADQVGKFTVFNIAGNAYRLITVIHFNTGRVYVRRVLTHAVYTRGTWRDD